MYAAVDLAIGRIVAALPEGADLMVISPVGMDVNTSRADMLPEMLAAVLGPSRLRPLTATRPRRPPGRPSGGSGPRCRAACGRGSPTLPERLALDLTARLELQGLDWKSTKAFAHPAENQGYVRLNLVERERDGIVTPAEAGPLLDEIASGLRTFRDLDGTPAVASIERVADLFGSGTHADLLPDLIVRWTNTPATHVRGPLRSVRHRHAPWRRSGRSGNHTEGDAWVLVVPGGSRPVEPDRPPRLEDIAATAVALSGESTAGMVGQPLLER